MSLDPENLQTLDAVEAALRQQGEAADQATSDSTEAPAPETSPEASDPVEAPTDEPPQPDADQDPPTSESSAEEKSDSTYRRAKKDAERLDRSWKKLEEEKAELARQREEIAQRGTQASPSDGPGADSGASLQDDHGFTHADYRDAVARFREQGEHDLADLAQARASELEGREAEQRQISSEQAHIQKWNGHAKAIVEAKPELKDIDSPLARKVHELLQAGPQFHVFEDGFARAVDHAETLLKAARVEDLSAEIQRLTEENTQLRDATSIGGGDPAGPPGKAKRIDELPSHLAEARLRAQAAEADASPL